MIENKLPLTNKHKFTRSSEIIKSFYGKINIEYFYLERERGIDAYITCHANSIKLVSHMDEGISLSWEGNPFDLDFIEDNYLYIKA